MRFSSTELDGVWLIEMEPQQDSRGWFARTFCEREFAAHGLATRFVQHSTSHNAALGTIRGLHFQRAPHAETKLVRCLRGAIYDVIVDIRPESKTFRAWRAFELTADLGTQLYVPAGLAHGFQTLTPDAEVGYLISEFHTPAAAAGVRFDDPAFAVRWPLPVGAISDRDRRWPDYSETSAPSPEP